MSLQDSLTIKCPGCHSQQTVTVWKSINTAADPAIKEAVRNKKAFLFCCPECGHETVLDYGFLYHQPEDKLLIQYADDDESAVSFLSGLQEQGNPLNDFANAHYIIRLVCSQNQLIEKLLIFDEGLDDRLIEIYKVLVLLRYQKENPDVEEPVLYFYRTDKGEQMIQILANDVYICSTAFNPALYEELKGNFGAALNDITDEEPIIDEQWAFSLMLGEQENPEG